MAMRLIQGQLGVLGDGSTVRLRLPTTAFQGVGPFVHAAAAIPEWPTPGVLARVLIGSIPECAAE